MNARQSAGQINKIKWQTHYKASGSQAGIRRQVEWTRQVATSRQQVGNGIDVQQQCNAGCTEHTAQKNGQQCAPFKRHNGGSTHDWLP